MQWKDFEVVEADFLEKKPLCECALFGFFLLPLKSSLRNVQNTPDFLLFPSFYSLLQISRKQLHIFVPTFSYIHI